IGIVIANFNIIPETFALIFKGAFSGTAAVGGFAGAAVSKTIRQGVARSIYSNEAGWGSSPMVHASANTPHPVRQGLWGSFEVFVDTILVCSVTALADLTAAEGTIWSSGTAGASLAIKAFSSTFGTLGGHFITISVFLFGMTTTTGWFVYYEVLLRQLFRKNPGRKDKVIKGFKVFYVLPGMFNVYLAVSGGNGPVFMWAIADCINAIPTFVNIVVLLLLHKTYLKLLRDYKARYLGVGTVDPNFKVFYDTEEQPVSVG
ncbi:MAG TPA: alanine:cation symporter family protein, partial [Terriglobales bacterium]|nr:alanine:cation symporter family protein [Terriglobales bacterium]